MKIKFKNKTYCVQWPKEFDAIIIRVAKQYRQGNFIYWKKAEQDGALKGLPTQLSPRDIGTRFSFLKYYQKYKEAKKRSTERWIRRIGREAYRKKVNQLIRKRLQLISIIPREEKLKHNWHFKTIWNLRQKRILIRLVEKHQKKKIIDWKALVQENDIKKLPYQDRLRLMKYYAICIKRPIEVEERRRQALEYKNNNYSRYLENLNRYCKMRRKVARDFLLSQLTLRT